MPSIVSAKKRGNEVVKLLESDLVLIVELTQGGGEQVEGRSRGLEALRGELIRDSSRTVVEHLVTRNFEKRAELVANVQALFLDNESADEAARSVTAQRR